MQTVYFEQHVPSIHKDPLFEWSHISFSYYSDTGLELDICP